MAIDLISQDVYRAGQGLPEFAQVFTRNLNGVGPVGLGRRRDATRWSWS